MNTLEEIKENISGPSDDARFTAWMSLYTSKEPEFMEEINKILLSEDAILKVLEGETSLAEVWKTVG